MLTFIDRLMWILGDRTRFRWCEDIGIGRGRATTMFGDPEEQKEATPPTADALNAIRRYENISTTWLLEGKGQPCIVSTLASDEAGATRVRQLLTEQSWEVHVISDRLSFALVLTQPGQYQVKERTVDYSNVEILAGALAGKTMREVYEARSRVTVFAVGVDTATLTELVEGRVSNLKLLRSKPAMLDGKRPMLDGDTLWQWPEASSILLSSDEQRLLERFRAMSPGQRKMFLRIGRTLLEDDDGSADIQRDALH